MKSILVLVVVIFSVISISAQEGNFHQFKVKTLEGEDFDMASLKGKKVMVINVASKCGLTPQYEDIQALYEEYGGDNFEIIAFPANNFLNQEPGSPAEIREFCTSNYGVTFPMMEKVSVKGDDIHPVYEWLTQKDKNGVLDAGVQWNFQKFLIDEDGNFVTVLKPKESVLSDHVIGWIEE